MKVYVDANVYVAYLLGERDERQVDEFFLRCLECRFSLVASPVLFREIQVACGFCAQLLLQHGLDRLHALNKIQVIRPDASDERQAD